MKKFSNISKTKSPKEEENLDTTNPVSNIRYSIHQLIEEFLSIQIYGPIDPILMGTIKIEGQEEFIDAMVDFMKTKEVKDIVKVLENAKYVGIDTCLNKLTNINESLTPSEKAKHIKRIKDIIKRADGNYSKMVEDVTTQAERITNGEKAFYRGITAENLIGEIDVKSTWLKKISEIFIFRSQKLGFVKNG